MAEGLKVMAMEGHGVAFLPYSAVKKELRARKLVSRHHHLALPVSGDGDGAPSVSGESRSVAKRRRPKGTAQALWTYLVSGSTS